MISPEDITLVMCCYNCQATVGLSIASLFEQRRDFGRFIVVDDGSEDETGDTLRTLSGMLDFEIVSLPWNVGPGAARNAAMQLVDSPYVVFVDSDDIYLPGHVASLSRHGGPSHIVSPSALVWNSFSGIQMKEKTHLHGFPSWRNQSKKLLSDNFVYGSCLVPFQAWKKVGGFFDLRVAEDWTFWIRCSLNGYTFVRSPNATVLYRRSNQNLSGLSKQFFESTSSALQLISNDVPPHLARHRDLGHRILKNRLRLWSAKDATNTVSERLVNSAIVLFTGRGRQRLAAVKVIIKVLAENRDRLVRNTRP